MFDVQKMINKKSNKEYELDLKRCVDKTVFKPRFYNVLNECEYLTGAK